MARIEKLSFDAYNESDVLIAAAERYYERTGHYPECILADKVYRNRKNLAYCREHWIRLSGPSLGRPKKNAGIDKKTEYKDNTDRISVKRAFALAKQKYGLGLITSRLDETTRCSIALSIIAMNVDPICRSFLHLFYDIVFSGYKRHESMLIFIQNNTAENLVCCYAVILYKARTKSSSESLQPSYYRRRSVFTDFYSHTQHFKQFWISRIKNQRYGSKAIPFH